MNTTNNPRFAAGPASATSRWLYLCRIRAGFTGTAPQAIPIIRKVMMEKSPICRRGLSVRCPRSAAVGSPCFNATHAWQNSCRQMEKITSTAIAANNRGFSKSSVMNKDISPIPLSGSGPASTETPESHRGAPPAAPG